MNSIAYKSLSLIVLTLLLALCGGCASSCPTPNAATWLPDMISSATVDRQYSTSMQCQNMQWQRYRIMSAQLSIDSLVHLTGHPAPTIRCYAFFALYERGYKALGSIAIEHLYDTSRVRVCSGECSYLNTEEMVGDVMWRAPFFCDTTRRATAETSLINTNKLNTVERERADSLVLYDTRIHLMISKAIFASMQPKASYYQRLHDVADKENNEAALIPLSTYRKASDIPVLLRPDTSCESFIKTWAEDTIPLRSIAFARAVRNFPDTAFFSKLRELAYLAEQTRNSLDVQPVTEKVKKLSLQEALCPPTAVLQRRCTELHYVTIQALTQYHTSAAKKLLEELISMKREVPSSGYRTTTMGILWLWWKKFPDPYFADLLKRIENNYQFPELKKVWEKMEDIP